MVWRGIRAALGLGPRRDLGPEARLTRALRAAGMCGNQDGSAGQQHLCCTKPLGHNGQCSCQFSKLDPIKAAL